MTDSSTRPYSSPLREAKAQRTREKIIDAALKVLGDRAAAFTMPAVAKVANVSLPTVYRLFPNKDVLTDVASQEVRARFGVSASGLTDIDAVLERQRQHIDHASREDERLLRALYRLNAEPLSREELRRREALLHEAIAGATQGLDDQDRQRFTKMISIIFSSMAAMSLWRFRLLNDEGAELIDWTVRTLVAGMHATKGET